MVGVNLILNNIITGQGRTIVWYTNEHMYGTLVFIIQHNPIVFSPHLSVPISVNPPYSFIDLKTSTSYNNNIHWHPPSFLTSKTLPYIYYHDYICVLNWISACISHSCTRQRVSYFTIIICNVIFYIIYNLFRLGHCLILIWVLWFWSQCSWFGEELDFSVVKNSIWHISKLMWGVSLLDLYHQ